MLTKVAAIIQPNISPAFRHLSNDLKEHGVDIAISSYDDRAWKEETTEQGTLYITDSESVYRTLRQMGHYALPYRHDGNGDASFAGALYVIEQIEEIGYETVDMAYRRLADLPWEILTTERCIVRETIVEDVDSFYRIYAEPEITKYMEDLYDNRDEEIAYIRDYREIVYGFYGYGMWTIQTKEGTVIGRAGISCREGFDVPELGFVIGVTWQRQGYAYEVCSAILDYARNELGFTQIQALVMKGNDKSERLCKKLGFQYVQDIILDSEIYEQMMKQFTDEKAGEKCE